MTEVLVPEVAVGAVALRDDEILLIRRGHGVAAGEWSIPGGRVQANEPLAAAVAREFCEETGLEAVVNRFLGWTERMGSDPFPYHYVILDFAVDLLDPTMTPRAAGDAAEAAWVACSHLAELNLVTGLHDFLIDVGAVPDPLDDAVKPVVNRPSAHKAHYVN